MRFSIHPNAIVKTKTIGANTRIWAFVHIINDVTIGDGIHLCWSLLFHDSL